MCPAPLGNRFWEQRSRHGSKPKFDSADKLWEACTDYFEWVEDHPLIEVKSYQYQGMPFQDEIPKMRAMTIAGLCIFLDITTETWYQMKKREGFTDVIIRADQIIRQQKFEGASADMLNPNIIALDLGLRTDKPDNSSEALLGVIKNLLERLPS